MTRDEINAERWLPTEENLAVLPDGVKQYIHALETNADPAGTVRQNVLLRDEVAQLRALVEADHQDAERYRWLRDAKPCQLYITRNADHACNYMTAKDWIEECSDGTFSDDPPEEIERMKETNTIWTIQIYPDTPIGSYVFNRATLDAAIDAAMGSENGDG